jgi:hypothetical protein
MAKSSNMSEACILSAFAALWLQEMFQQHSILKLLARHKGCMIHMWADVQQGTKAAAEALASSMSHACILYSCLLAPLQEMFHQHSILKLLAQMSSRALKLLVETLASSMSHACMSYLRLALLSPLQEMFHQHSILKLLAQMSSRALKLLQQATPKERSKVALLSAFVEVQMLLQFWHMGWRSCYDASDAAAVAAQQQLALQQLQQTGKCLHCASTITRITLSQGLAALLAARCLIASLSARASQHRIGLLIVAASPASPGYLWCECVTVALRHLALIMRHAASAVCRHDGDNFSSLCT